MADSKIHVAPSRSFSIFVAFMAAKENEVVVMDDKFNPIWSTNSEQDQPRKWAEKNDGSATKTYIVRGLYKEPDGKDWLESRVHESFGGDNSLIIGYEEDRDDDFNDAVASVGF